jgi:hypothetical protein
MLRDREFPDWGGGKGEKVPVDEIYADSGMSGYLNLTHGSAGDEASEPYNLGGNPS